MFATTIYITRMEMGSDEYWFHHQVTQNTKASWLHHCSGGQVTKAAHFIPIMINHKETNIERIYINKVVRLCGMPKAIVSGRDSKFTLNFWKELFKGFNKKINFSKICHLQIDGKIERVNQVIKDMLWIYVMDMPFVTSPATPGWASSHNLDFCSSELTKL